MDFYVMEGLRLHLYRLHFTEAEMIVSNAVTSMCMSVCVWAHSRAGGLSKIYLLSPFSLRIPQRHTASQFSPVSCPRLLPHTCPLTASLSLYYMPGCSLLQLSSIASLHHFWLFLAQLRGFADFCISREETSENADQFFWCFVKRRWLIITHNGVKC